MKKQSLNKVVSALLVFFLCAAPVSMYAEKGDGSIAPKDKISEELYQEITRLEAEGKNLEKEKIPV